MHFWKLCYFGCQKTNVSNLPDVYICRPFWIFKMTAIKNVFSKYLEIRDTSSNELVTAFFNFFRQCYYVVNVLHDIVQIVYHNKIYREMHPLLARSLWHI